jgi:hypothetical protein
LGLVVLLLAKTDTDIPAKTQITSLMLNAKSPSAYSRKPALNIL